ncbi:hypothetical protein Tcan_12686 [Toxocara canis]|uniref:Uncharacterized protein n=1 Tax=Toxocara canis TaxID=6265 RepID=A0A0B2V2N5_TOXCA|nr:hypothetical protein Tcan_12686 [Toxocara canis]
MLKKDDERRAIPLADEVEIQLLKNERTAISDNAAHIYIAVNAFALWMSNELGSVVDMNSRRQGSALAQHNRQQMYRAGNVRQRSVLMETASGKNEKCIFCRCGIFHFFLSLFCNLLCRNHTVPPRL